MDTIIANVRKLSEMVAYDENAIVSKVLVKKKTGNITLFSFWAGQELSEHTSPYDAFLFCIDGDGIVTIDGQEFFLTTGDVILMPANHPHSVKAKSNFKMLLVMIKDFVE
ncbi:MAG: cupin domain-containing protein [Candidatus Kapaibacteriota bacterium]